MCLRTHARALVARRASCLRSMNPGARLNVCVRARLCTHGCSHVGSVRKGDMLSKKDKGWDKPKERNRHIICIEDPFDVEKDLGCYVDEQTIKDIEQVRQPAVALVVASRRCRLYMTASCRHCPCSGTLCSPRAQSTSPSHENNMSSDPGEQLGPVALRPLHAWHDSPLFCC